MAYLVLLLLILACQGVTFALSFEFNINACIFLDYTYTVLLLHRPWFRLPSYLIGIILGMELYKIHYSQLEFRFKIKTRVILYLIGFAMTFISVFVLYFNLNCTSGYESPSQLIGCYSNLENSLYTTFAPMTFNIGLILIVMPALIERNYNPRNYLSLR